MAAGSQGCSEGPSLEGGSRGRLAPARPRMGVPRQASLLLLSLSCFSFTPVGLNLHLRHRFLFKTPTFCPLCALCGVSFGVGWGEPSYPSVPTGKGFPPRLLRKAVSVVPCYETPPGLQPLDCSHRKDPAGLTAFRVLLPWARRGPPQSSWAPILQMSSTLRPVSSDQDLSPGYQAFSWA